MADDLAERRVGGISLDLSHIGSLVDRDLARRNLARIVQAAAAAEGEVMISMENHDRTDQILDDHDWIASVHAELAERYTHVGVTIQARLHRSSDDLDLLLERPGRIRVVKGAYPFPAP